jgi:TetR/AcrR family transcriptional regulator, transcriptional repressor for nem operon
MAATTGKRSAPSHKERLLIQGMREFYATGFHGTSVDTVLAEAGVPKGSFYHHFGSKEAFAMAVVREYYEDALKRLGKWIQDSGSSAPDRIQGYILDLTRAFEKLGQRRGCLIGKFSLELAPVSDSFSALLSAMLSGWKAGIDQIIVEGQQAGTIRKDLGSSVLADIVLSSIQGSLVLCLAHRNSAAMHSAAKAIPALLAPAR